MSFGGGTPVGDPAMLLVADRVMDGTGATTERGAVLVRGRHIEAIGTGTDLLKSDAAAGAEVRDYGDATILPGLVDAHTHLVSPGDGTEGDDVAAMDPALLLLVAARNAGRMLASGVTTLRENGAPGHIAFALREGIRRGLVLGPQLVVCGRPLAITGGHLGYFGGEADRPAHLRQAVRQLVKEGADFIKVTQTGGSTLTSHPRRPAFDVAELRAIVDEAHRFGLLTGAHCVASAGVEHALDGGVDMIIHCIFTDPDGSYRYRPDLVDRILAAGAWVNPTLYNGVQPFIDRLESALERDGELPPGDRTRLEDFYRERDNLLEGARLMARAGVRFAAGSDTPWQWGAAGSGQAREIAYLTMAGIPADAAIIAGTSAAAEAIGRGATAGRLAVGREADVLVVQGDPRTEIIALTEVQDVVQAGRRVDRGID